MLTLAEVCEELAVSRSTFCDWRAKRRARRCIKLPNGDLRIRRSDLDHWFDDAHRAGAPGSDAHSAAAHRGRTAPAG
ncbi:helix-turn-helix transcriptional regulator [Streptomyces sp. MB22_4]|uniref:helix-turn-helix transcriptional regulator n=1 Tax=Streptomyces sp. MB22_4 TaxID=3383120 RepID=UPI00399F4EDE